MRNLINKIVQSVGWEMKYLKAFLVEVFCYPNHHSELDVDPKTLQITARRWKPQR